MNIDKTTGSSFIQSYQKQMQVSPVERSKPIQKEDLQAALDKFKKMKNIYGNGSGGSQAPGANCFLIFCS